jgi:hypothetical protein
MNEILPQDGPGFVQQDVFNGFFHVHFGIVHPKPAFTQVSSHNLIEMSPKVRDRFLGAFSIPVQCS